MMKKSGFVNALIVICAFVLFYYSGKYSVACKDQAEYSDVCVKAYKDVNAGSKKRLTRVYSYEELCNIVNKKMKNGYSGKMVFKIAGSIDEKEIKNINNDLESFYGSIDSYIIYTNKKLVLNYKKSDAMFVYESFTRQKTIPYKRKKALRLKSVCEKY